MDINVGQRIYTSQSYTIHPPNNNIMEAATTTTTSLATNIIIDDITSFNECDLIIIDHLETQQQVLDSERLESVLRSIYAPCNFRGCCKVYTRGSAYRSLFWHQQASHNGQIYHCHFYSKGFNTSRDLSIHQDKYCMDAKIYICTSCQKQYMDLKTFHLHNQTHENQDKHPMLKKSFKCEHCPSQYHMLSKLTKHVHFKHKL